MGHPVFFPSSRGCLGHVLQAPRFDFELAHLVLLNLAAERGRELVCKADVLGDFVVGDLALAEFA